MLFFLSYNFLLFLKEGFPVSTIDTKFHSLLLQCLRWMSVRNVFSAICGSHGTALSSPSWWFLMPIFIGVNTYCCISQVQCVFVHVSQRKLCYCCSSLANVNHAKQHPSRNHLQIWYLDDSSFDPATALIWPQINHWKCVSEDLNLWSRFFGAKYLCMTVTRIQQWSYLSKRHVLYVCI
jgi:hypothetical protein